MQDYDDNDNGVYYGLHNSVNDDGGEWKKEWFNNRAKKRRRIIMKTKMASVITSHFFSYYRSINKDKIFIISNH